MAQADDRLDAVKAALLPGAALYGLIGWVLVTNVAPVWAGLPCVVIVGAANLMLGPLLRRFSPIKSPRVVDAYKPAFFRFYLGGRALALAYAYTYLALGLFVGGWRSSSSMHVHEFRSASAATPTRAMSHVWQPTAEAQPSRLGPSASSTHGGLGRTGLR